MKYMYKKLPTGKMMAYIDITPELDMKDYGGEDIFLFQIATYGNLHKTKIAEDRWNNACFPPNELFKTFSKDDCRYFVEAVVDIKLDIMEFFSDIDTGKENIINIPKFTTRLSKRLLQLDADINLCPRIRQLVDDKNIQTGVPKNIELRPQDTKKMTFSESEAKDLIAIIILCKLLFPITGEIIARLKPSNLGKHQDPHCKAITNGLVTKYWSTLYLKLDNYINQFVAKETNNARLYQVYNGMNEMSLCIFIISNLFVRNFINFNLFDPSAKSVMSYIYSIITHVIKTQASQCYSNRVTKREPIASEEEPGNVADLEVHSVSTKSQFDTVAIIDVSISSVGKKVMELYDVDPYKVELMCEYYNKHPLEPSPLTTSVLVGFYRFFMSGKNICYINSDKYVYLVSIVQLILINQNKLELAAVLSSVTTGIETPVDITAMQKLRTFDKNYITIEQEFDMLNGIIGVNNYKEHVTKIIEALVTKEYLANLPVLIYDDLGMENVNNKKLTIGYNIMAQYYQFMVDMF